MNQLVSLYSDDKRIQYAVKKLDDSSSYDYSLTNTSFDSIFFALCCQKLKGRTIVVCANDSEAQALYSDISTLNLDLKLFSFASSLQVKNKKLSRSNSKNLAQNLVVENIEQEDSCLIITYPEACIEKFLVPKDLGHVLTIKKGDKISLTSLVEYFEDNGYERNQFVYEYGQYSIRGNIIDVYSYAYKNPIRIELFDVEVEDIRLFDIETQLSISDIEELKITTNPKLRKGLNYEIKSILDYAKEGLLFSIDEKSLKKKLKSEIAFCTELENDLEEDINSVLLKTSTISKLVLPNRRIVFSNSIKSMEIEPTPIIHKNFNKLHQLLGQYEEDEFEVYIMSDDVQQEERYRQIFEDLGGAKPFIHVPQELHLGFVDLELKKVFLTTHEIFAKRLYHNVKNTTNVSAQAQLLKSMRELVPGDFVTHLDHGIGRFSGLEKIEVGGHFQEAVRLIYANRDILYVHINSLHKISKYVGKEGTEPKLHRLGSDTWANTKRKTKRKIKDIAEDLIKLYAKRKASKGFAFSPDSYLQYELETSFEFEDTPDQAKASQDVKADMEKEIPMDRLVCGDVGFGKTEVAIRAAFKAVADSKQVAVLVPTTLLAFQHYRTFKKRLEGLPCSVDYINRFKSAKQKSETIKKLENGQLDILIGTHALVGKKVKFKDLGLLIVDEEQKFGVQVKEKLKELKLNVDTLTMTATPIPRTLQFSLLGARDYSLIQTPPPRRQAIYTEVAVFDPDYVQEIIRNEVNRGGQVFFVHNKVKDLYQLKETLDKIIPEMDIAIAHGQLEGEAIEKTLIDFIDKKYDVLLSTNIIESGIDIPNANTMIINNAHHFGLSDLHQLRGRVGRSDKKAYCYLLSPPYSSLTSDAKQRLNAMEQNAALGSGFQIAMRDLDLRGAGNLLGGEQSGFIGDIGYDTFMKILDEAITELKEIEYKDLYNERGEAKEINFSKDCQIETDKDMYIPDEYIVNSQDRMKIYSDLNQIENETELYKYLKNVKDVYGTLPIQINEISETIQLKWIALKLGIERIVLKKSKLKCLLIQNQESPYFQSDVFTNLLGYMETHPSQVSLKQTPKSLIISFQNITNTKQAREKLKEVWSFKKA